MKHEQQLLKDQQKQEKLEQKKMGQKQSSSKVKTPRTPKAPKAKGGQGGQSSQSSGLPDYGASFGGDGAERAPEEQRSADQDNILKGNPNSTCHVFSEEIAELKDELQEKEEEIELLRKSEDLETKEFDVLTKDETSRTDFDYIAPDGAKVKILPNSTGMPGEEGDMEKRMLIQEAVIRARKAHEHYEKKRRKKKGDNTPMNYQVRGLEAIGLDT